MLTGAQKDRTLQYIESLKTDSFTFREVVRHLDLDSDDRRSLQKYLDELDSEGVVRRIKRGRYALPSKEKLVAGVLQCHRDGYGFLVPDDRARYKEDVFIPGRNMGGALHGDHVLARIERKKVTAGRGRRRRRTIPEKQRMEGVVAAVIERRHPHIVGRYCAHPRFPFVIPLDTRIFHDIRIPFHHSKNARDGQIVSVEIVQAPGRNLPAQGKIQAVLGNPGDPGIEYAIVQYKYGLPTDFSPQAVSESDSLPDHVLEKEHAGREDFRNETAVTIDGETARDFDDAVSLKKLSSGRYLLGVHIADVSHYVRENSALDIEAYTRGTSVYFPDRSLPMLPHKLSSGICSLRPNADRLVLSALMEIDRKGKIIQSRFCRGILRSRERMTYESVAAILENRDRKAIERYSELVPMFHVMKELCEILAEKRYRRGAIDFDLPEADIRIDTDGKVISVAAAERNTAHRIIEEFMIAANECAAEKLESSGEPALFRVHDQPDPVKVEEFSELAQSLGHPLEKHKGQYRPKDFQVFVRRMDGKPEQKYLIYQMLRSFMLARYSEKNTGHFGLAADAYTHFTSPIRRYPDLVVHRLLKAAILENVSADFNNASPERMQEIAKHTSTRERTAEEAEREIERIKKAQFMSGKIGEEFEGVILSVSGQGFYVELLEHYVEGFVPFTVLIDDEYRFSERAHAITGSRRRNRFSPGTLIRVRLDNIDMESARLFFSVAGSR